MAQDTISGQELLTELGHSAWSGYNADDMVWDNEDSLQARIELNNALTLLYNLRDFPPLKNTQSIETDNATVLYNIPSGQIDYIYNTQTGEKLKFIGDSSAYDKTETGLPSHYWVEFSKLNGKIRLYPAPDNLYTFEIVYKDFRPVITADKKKRKFTLENADDLLSVPVHLLQMFKNCLIAKTIVNSIIDEQDENYRPMITKFNEFWDVFKRSAARTSKIENRVVW